MGKNRVETFFDGVVAIIITIMVLEMKVPRGVELKELAPVMPVFLSYVLSFIYLGIYWNNHHHMMHTCRRAPLISMSGTLQVGIALSLERSLAGVCTMKEFFTCAVVAAVMAIAPAAFAVTQNHAEKLFLASAKSRQALIKLETAAKAGDAAAEDWLGLDYESGFSKGLPQSYRIALRWFKKSAKKGDANADFNLGQMYQVGAGVRRSFAEARHWYRLGAARGSAEAKYSLNVLAKLAQ